MIKDRVGVNRVCFHKAHDKVRRLCLETRANKRVVFIYKHGRRTYRMDIKRVG